MSEPDKITERVADWVETAVIGLNLCPFAETVLKQQRVSYTVSESRELEGLMSDLDSEIDLMHRNSRIETTLLIIPLQLHDFADFNQSLDLVDLLLESNGWSGEYQIASFHPDYQFANTSPDDRENWSNRSPYPIYHILRESSIASAIEKYTDTDQIPARNILRLNSLTQASFERIFLRKHE